MEVLFVPIDPSFDVAVLALFSCSTEWVASTHPLVQSLIAASPFAVHQVTH